MRHGIKSTAPSFILLIFLTAPFTTLSGQNENSLRVDRILVEGNFQTRSETILREMLIGVGDTVTSESMTTDENRIQNLQLFNRTRLILVRTGGENVLYVEVTERLYRFPFPMAFLTDKKWSKLSYGGGLIDTNFRGRGEILSVVGWIGFDPGYELLYRNPWIGSGPKISLTLKAQSKKSSYRNVLPPFDNAEYGYEMNKRQFYADAGYRLGYYLTFSGGAFYTMRTIADDTLQVLLSSSGTDRIISMFVNIEYDDRDLVEFPHTGQNIIFNLMKRSVLNHECDYWRFYYNLRKYVPLSSMTLALWHFGEYSFGGKLPLYDRVYIGYNRRIRGRFAGVMEGENTMGFAVEIRFPLRKISYHSINYSPSVAPTTFKELKFGLSGGIWVNTGTTWMRSEELNTEMFRGGYGISLYIHVPFINVVRFDLGSSDTGEIEIVFDVFKPF